MLKNNTCSTQCTLWSQFSVIDTVSLGALYTGQTVLAKICKELDIEYDNELAHSAAYDAEITAKVFCKIFNNFELNS